MHSIGGLVVKLAVAIRRSSSDNVGQPRVRFPADAVNGSEERIVLHVFDAWLRRTARTRLWLDYIGGRM